MEAVTCNKYILHKKPAFFKLNIQILRFNGVCVRGVVAAAVDVVGTIGVGVPWAVGDHW